MYRIHVVNISCGAKAKVMLESQRSLAYESIKVNLLSRKCFTGRLRPRITEIGVDFILFWTQYGVLLFRLNRP